MNVKQEKKRALPKNKARKLNNEKIWYSANNFSSSRLFLFLYFSNQQRFMKRVRGAEKRKKKKSECFKKPVDNRRLKLFFFLCALASLRAKAGK